MIDFFFPEELFEWNGPSAGDPLREEARLWRRCIHRCAKCGMGIDVRETETALRAVAHPISASGGHRTENLVLLCWRCEALVVERPDLHPETVLRELRAAAETPRAVRAPTSREVAEVLLRRRRWLERIWLVRVQPSFDRSFVLAGSPGEGGSWVTMLINGDESRDQPVLLPVDPVLEAARRVDLVEDQGLVLDGISYTFFSHVSGITQVLEIANPQSESWRRLISAWFAVARTVVEATKSEPLEQALRLWREYEPQNGEPSR